MRSSIAVLTHDRKTGRMLLSLDVVDGDTISALLYDSAKRAPGTFLPTIYGTLYVHDDKEIGLPGLGFGEHAITVRKKRFGVTTNISGKVQVLDPPSTLGPDRVAVAHPESLLPHLWAAGFRVEEQLLWGLAIAVGESGLYIKARNWLPSSGFRPPETVLGVPGPAAAWNQDHSAQGHSDRGLYQVNSRFHGRFTDAQCDDPAQACGVLWSMTGGGVDWRAWGFGAGGSHYEQFFDGAHGFPALRPLVAAFLKQQ